MGERRYAVAARCDRRGSEAATAVLANFRPLSGERPVKVHLIVAWSVDPTVLERMRVRVDGTGYERVDSDE